MATNPQPLLLFVPGKNPKPEPVDHTTQLLRCLVAGLRARDDEHAEMLANNAEWFEVLPWNPLFYGQVRDIADELQWIDRLLAVGPATRLDRREAHAWKTRLAWLLYSLADRIPALIPLIANDAIRSTIEETLLYFKDIDGIASRVRTLLRRRLQAAMDENRPTLLIGHSMGSVIAYDTLWEMSRQLDDQRKVSMLLTMGSPLGLRFVQKRLLGANEAAVTKYPANISRWVNISSMGELTALDREFADDFHEMVEFGLLDGIEDHHRGIYNAYRDELGLNVHRSYGYMVNTATAKVVSDWLHRVTATH